MHIESGLSTTLSRWSDPLRINSIPIWAGMLHDATLTFSHELSRCFHLVGWELDLLCLGRRRSQTMAAIEGTAEAGTSPARDAGVSNN